MNHLAFPPTTAAPPAPRPLLRTAALAPRVRADYWPGIAVFLTVGYLSASRSFAYLGVPQLKIFIGEIVLAAFLLTHPRAVIDLWANAIARPSRLKMFCVLLAIFMAYGIFELARGVSLGRPVLDAAHDFSFQYYGLYFFIGIYVGIRSPQTLRSIGLWLGWLNGIYGILFIAFFSRTYVSVLETAGSGVNPGSDVNMFGQPYGSAVAIFGLICFERRWQRIVIPVILNAVVLLAMDIRSEWMGFIMGALVFALLSRQFTKLLVGAGAIAALLAASYVLDLRIPKPATRGGGTTSARDIVGRVLAPIDPSLAKEYSDGVRVASATATWRSTWWKAIWDSIRDDNQLLVIGHGYGYPITDLVSYLRGRHYIRTPHSYVFFALGYGGLAMLGIFAALQIALGRLLYQAFIITGQAFGLVAYTVLLTWGLFDSSFESPYRAAPFFIITGIAAGPAIVRKARSVLPSPSFRPVLRPRAGYAVIAVLLLAGSARAQVTFDPTSENIADTVAHSAAGVKFYFAPGVYRNLQLVPKDDQVFTAQPGVIFNGSTLITSFVRQGQFWAIPNRAPTGQSRGTCDDSHPRCMIPQDLFFDDQPLRHVESRNSLVPGAWYYDYTNATIYFFDSPVNHKVELSVSRTAFSGPAVNVTIDGFVVEKYANEAQVGAIGDLDQGAGWVIRNNEVRLNHGVGITLSSFGIVSRNHSHHNGHLGIATAETGQFHVRKAIIENNEVDANNWAGFHPSWAAGGIKVCSVIDFAIRSNSVHDNLGPGIWSDIDSSTVLYEDNTVVNNRGIGIIHEISDSAVIRNNTVSGNFITNPLWYWGAQILIQNSKNVEVYENSVDVPPGGHGIIIVQQDRGSQYPARNNNIHHNVVAYQGEGGQSGLASDFDAQNAVQNQNNIFDYNTYRVRKLPGAHWIWNVPKDRAQFQAAGQEAHGTVTVGN